MKEKKVIDMTLSELVDKSLKEGKIPLFTFEPIEENKSNDSFQWDDSKVKELLWNRFPFPEGVTSVQPILDEFKKNYPPKPQAENKPDWEVVRMETGYGLVLHTSTQVAWPEWEVIGLLDRGYKINSVKRKSDGEVFSVGDEVFIKNDTKTLHREGKIVSFKIINNGMEVKFESPITGVYFYYLPDLHKKLPPQPHIEEQREQIRIQKEFNVPIEKAEIYDTHPKCKPQEQRIEVTDHWLQDSTTLSLQLSEAWDGKKWPAIKQAIEQVLNDDKPFMTDSEMIHALNKKKYHVIHDIQFQADKQKVDAMCEDAWTDGNIAGELNNKRTFQDYKKSKQ